MRRALAILAAGSATRAGVDKVLADLGGQPVLAWSLASGLAAGCFEEIVVIAPQANLSRVASVVRERAPAARVGPGGGATTAPSWGGLRAVARGGVVAVPDAARAFVP